MPVVGASAGMLGILEMMDKAYVRWLLVEKGNCAGSARARRAFLADDIFEQLIF